MEPTPTPTIPAPNVASGEVGKASPIFAILLVIIFLLSAGFAGFLYMQNIQLKNQLQTLTAQPSPTPTISPEPIAKTDEATMSAIASPSAAPKIPF